MGFHARIDLENSDALLALDDLRRRQLPFAQALALTRTAAKAQKKIRRDLPDRFTLRNKYVSTGVRMEKATKKRPEAAVFWRGRKGRSKFGDQLALQATGGKKSPRGRTIALRRGAKRGKGGTTPLSQQPAALLKKKNVFIKDVRGGAGILQRVRGGRPRLLYFLKRGAVNIPKRWEFRETVRDEAQRIYRKEFGRAFAKALATGKK